MPEYPMLTRTRGMIKMENNTKLVIALGHDALGDTLPEQKSAVLRASKILAKIIAGGYSVIITHSNGPQIGMIHMAMNELSGRHDEFTPSPMSVCSAMSQGYIGYDLQNAIRTELLNRGIYKGVVTILTQTIVDPYDEAFYHPSKIIGRTMNEEDAEREEKKGNFVVETNGGYRRILPAPKPLDIVEMDAINALLEAGQTVIAAGGGGIPVLEQENRLQGASAVIEKDLCAGLLADKADADILMILTYEEKQSILDGDERKLLCNLSVDRTRQYIKEHRFGIGTKLPKFEAASYFTGKRQGRKTIITNLESSLDALEGKTGTVIE